MATFKLRLPIRVFSVAALIPVLIAGLSACADRQDDLSLLDGTARHPISMGDYDISGVEIRRDHLEYRSRSGDRIRVYLRGPGVLSAENGSFRFDLDFITGDVREATLDGGQIASSLQISRRRESDGAIRERYRFQDGSMHELRRVRGSDPQKLEESFLEWYRPRAQRADLLDNVEGRSLMRFLNAPQFHRSLLTGLGAQLSTDPSGVADPELLELLTGYLRRGKEDDDITESVCDLLSICAAVKCTLGGGPANPGCDACIGGAIGCRLGRLLNRVFDAIFGDGRGRYPTGWNWTFEGAVGRDGRWAGGYWPW
jgi:hypothetical protein